MSRTQVRNHPTGTPLTALAARKREAARRLQIRVTQLLEDADRLEAEHIRRQRKAGR
jgi:hypothetical protein